MYKPNNFHSSCNHKHIKTQLCTVIAHVVHVHMHTILRCLATLTVHQWHSVSCVQLKVLHDLLQVHTNSHTPHWRQKSLHTQITSEDLLWFTAQGSTMRILAFSMLATPSMHLLVRCVQFGSACLACALMQMHFFPLSLCTKSYIQYTHYTKLVWSKFKPRTIFPPLLRHYEP